MKPLILASTSKIRNELLSRLQLSFEIKAPDTDETPFPGELAPDLVKRLSLSKATSVASHFPNSLIIGCDQVASLRNSIILGKPLNHSAAEKQLQLMSGQTVTFLAGLCLHNTATQNNQLSVEPYTVQFRNLTDEMIDCYLEKEQPYHCAGSFKSEALGITLIEEFIGKDPTSLMGLPLIQLCRFLENEGIQLP